MLGYAKEDVRSFLGALEDDLTSWRTRPGSGRTADGSAPWPAAAGDRRAPTAIIQEIEAAIEAAVEREVGKLRADAAERAGRAIEAFGPERDQIGGHPQSAVDERGVVELVRVALAATDRISEVVETVGSQVDGLDDLAALVRSLERALGATNERLGAVERLLRAQAYPAA